MSISDLFTRYSGMTDKNTDHTYGIAYEQFLPEYRDAKVVVEIGVDQGGSLLAWRDFFPHATIHGFEVKKRSILIPEDPRIVIHIQDATVPEAAAVFEDGEIDVLVDDGSHFFEHVVSSLIVFWPKVRSGGVYVIEDVQSEDAMHWLERIASLAYDAQVTRYDMRKNAGYDNVLLEIRKP